MNVFIIKRNSKNLSKKINTAEYNSKITPEKNNNSKFIITKKINKKIPNNLYIKSEHNIQKKTNELCNSVTYKKSLQTKKIKNQIYPKKNISIPDIKITTEKKDDTVSTMPLTKDNIKSLSCTKRTLNNNKNMIFVKKRIKDSLKNSFILEKENKNDYRNNSCCFIGSTKITNSPNIRYNTNNSVDFGRNNFYSNNDNYMDILNSFDNEHANNVLITNNNINLITNNNYINNSSTMPKAEKIIVRTNNSVTLRKKKRNSLDIFNDIDNKDKKIDMAQNLKNPIAAQIVKNNNRNSISYYENYNSYNVGLNSSDRKQFNINMKDNEYINSKRDIKNYIRNITHNIKNEYINTNIRSSIYSNSKLNNDLLNEINFEDFYLILKKFEIIKNNIILLGNLKNPTNRQILENINMSRIFIYDLYKFYLNSSFEGCPQDLFTEKNSKLYLRFYSVILIISLGLMYLITQRTKLTKDFRNKLSHLINLLQKGFLYFCDMLLENYDDKSIVNNMWINEIINELNNIKMPLGMNHILYIKKMAIEAYKIFNEIIINIFYINTNSNNNSISNKLKIKNNQINEQIIFLYRQFQNKSINYLAQINIRNLEEIFDEQIFKIINLRSNYANIASQKSITNIINSPFKLNFLTTNTKKGTNIKTFLYNENINNDNNNIKQIKSFNNTKRINKLKNSNSNTNIKSHLNYKNLIQSLKVKEPYLNFPPKKEYTLVLDLDETMISFQYISAEEGIGHMHLRPGLEKFLDVVKEYYEIIVFTSGTREYADMVLDIIEHKKQKKIFSGRLYREHTTQIGKKYIKDLSKLGRDLSRTLIVDNLPQSFKFQHENGILISSFYGDDKDLEEDKALIELEKILIKIYKEKTDVRKSIIKFKDEIIRKVSCLYLKKPLFHNNNNNINININEYNTNIF